MASKFAQIMTGRNFQKEVLKRCCLRPQIHSECKGSRQRMEEDAFHAQECYSLSPLLLSVIAVWFALWTPGQNDGLFDHRSARPSIIHIVCYVFEVQERLRALRRVLSFHWLRSIVCRLFR